MSKALEEVRKQVMQVPDGKIFQVEGTVSAKVKRMDEVTKTRPV